MAHPIHPTPSHIKDGSAQLSSLEGHSLQAAPRSPGRLGAPSPALKQILATQWRLSTKQVETKTSSL